MRLFTLFIFSVFIAFSSLVQAQETAGVQSFMKEAYAWRRQDGEKLEVLQSIIDSTTPAAIDNITKAEQVFCYQIESKPAGYTGYTIDGMAVTGFCGVINAELQGMIVKQFFATAENISNVPDKCIIRPKLMLRFVRGVDNTDVLLSAPCHSFSVFYAGKVKTYNFKPGAEIIDVMVNSFKGSTIPFTSPALLNQLLPIGVVQNNEQKQIIEEKRPSAPVRQWDTGKEPIPTTPAKKGWNNLKM